MAPWPETNRTKSETEGEGEEATVLSNGSSKDDAVLLGAASKPKDDTLYEELLRYHDDDSVTIQTDHKASIGSEEDTKLPAKPTAKTLQTAFTADDDAAPRNRVYSEPNTPASSLLVANTNNNNNNGTTTTAATTTIPSDARHSMSQGNTPPPSCDIQLKPQQDQQQGVSSGTVFGKPKPTPDDELLQQVQQFHTQHLDYQQAYYPETMHPPPIFSTTTSLEESQAPPPHQPVMNPPSSSSSTVPANSNNNSKSSFYQAALEASSGQTSPHSLFSNDTLEQDELLARELSEKLELEELQRQEQLHALEIVQPPPQEEDQVVMDATQLEIMKKIRLEAEQKQLQAALRESGGGSVGNTPTTTRTTATTNNTNTNSMTDYLLSQQLAMEEWQHVPRPPLRRASSEQQHHHQRSTGSNTIASSSNHTPPLPQRDDQVPYRVSMDHYTRPTTQHNHTTSRRQSSSSSSTANHAHSDDLLQRGSHETRQAIRRGQAHVVQCQGCGGRLQAPMSYALVYCPECHTVSPGQTYMASSPSGATLRRQFSVPKKSQP